MGDCRTVAALPPLTPPPAPLQVLLLQGLPGDAQRAQRLRGPARGDRREPDVPDHLGALALPAGPEDRAENGEFAALSIFLNYFFPPSTHPTKRVADGKNAASAISPHSSFRSTSRRSSLSESAVCWPSPRLARSVLREPRSSLDKRRCTRRLAARAERDRRTVLFTEQKSHCAVLLWARSALF